MHDWATIETFSVAECYIGAPKDDRAFDGSVWSTHPNLTTVSLRTFNTYAAIRHCLGQLPPSVTSLSIDDDLTYNPPSFADEFIECLTPYSTQLTALSILGSPSSRFPAHIARGRWDSALRQMTGLRKLGISLCAVANLAAALGPLEHLAEVEVVQTHLHSDFPLSHLEVLQLARRAGAELQKLRLGREAWTRWSGLEVAAVRRQAEARGVVLELEHRDESGGWSDEEWEDVSSDESTTESEGEVEGQRVEATGR